MSAQGTPVVRSNDALESNDAALGKQDPVVSAVVKIYTARHGNDVLVMSFDASSLHAGSFILSFLAGSSSRSCNRRRSEGVIHVFSVMRYISICSINTDTTACSPGGCMTSCM